MRSLVLAVMMWLDAMMGLDFDLTGRFRRSLVLLRGAHRSHRQFETVARCGVGCGGKCWNGEGERANSDQA